MLARQHRLVKKKDFEKIFEQGRACYAKFFGARILASQFQFNRFGMIVSSKISKKATERNKLKRQIRQAARELNKNLKPGFDLIIMALPGSLGQEYKKVKDELEKIFVKLRLLK